MKNTTLSHIRRHLQGNNKLTLYSFMVSVSDARWKSLCLVYSYTLVHLLLYFLAFFLYKGTDLLYLAWFFVAMVPLLHISLLYLLRITGVYARLNKQNMVEFERFILSLKLQEEVEVLISGQVISIKKAYCEHSKTLLREILVYDEAKGASHCFYAPPRHIHALSVKTSQTGKFLVLDKYLDVDTLIK